MDSNGQMHEMVTSMNEINEASQEIGKKIIATINEIASQTNLSCTQCFYRGSQSRRGRKRLLQLLRDQVTVFAEQSANAAKESAALIESSSQGC